MAIKISNKLKREVGDDAQRQNLESLLKEKSAGICYLCLAPFNYASDSIEADHDTPTDLGGQTTIENLNLTHVDCNRFKRNNPSILVKSYLPFKKFMSENDAANYDLVGREFFKIKPQPIHIENINLEKKQFDLHYPNGSSRKQIPFFSDKVPNRAADILYAYLPVPIKSIYNDSLQPRPIKLPQIWKLFIDLHSNPLHEPASVRLATDFKDGQNKLLMFDGQHKTASKLLTQMSSLDIENNFIDVKMYLNLDEESVTYLVNSIQNKVIKKSLTKLESANKLAVEHRNNWTNYCQKCSEESRTQSEYNFIQSLPPQERKRSANALVQSCITKILIAKDEESDLKILDLIDDKRNGIMQPTFFTKLLNPLVYRKPLKEPHSSQTLSLRERERRNVRFILHTFHTVCFASPNVVETKKFFRSQSSMSLLISLTMEYIKWAYKMELEHVGIPAAPLLFIELGNTTNVRLNDFFTKYVAHPIWKNLANYDPNHSEENVTLFRNALQKNENIKGIAHKINLNISFCSGLETLRTTQL